MFEVFFLAQCLKLPNGKHDKYGLMGSWKSSDLDNDMHKTNEGKWAYFNKKWWYKKQDLVITRKWSFLISKSNQLYESEIRLKQEQASLLYKFLNPYDENIYKKRSNKS